MREKQDIGLNDTFDNEVEMASLEIENNQTCVSMDAFRSVNKKKFQISKIDETENTEFTFDTR